MASQSRGRSGRGGGRGGRGGRGNSCRSQYTRGASWKKPQDGECGVRQINNVWMCHCKDCGWNKTHTSGFHSSWQNNKTSFSLPETHPQRLAIAAANVSKQEDAGGKTETEKKSDSPPASGNTFNQVAGKLDAMARETEDPHMAMMAQLLGKVFSSLKE